MRRRAGVQVLAMLMTLLLGACGPDQQPVETANAAQGTGTGSGQGKGSGGGRGGDGAAGCNELALIVDGETRWTASPERLPDDAPFSTYDERSAFSLSTLLDAYPDLRSVTLQACGPRSVRIERQQLIAREKLLVLNQRGRWKLGERDGSRHLVPLLLNVREIRVSTGAPGNGIDAFQTEEKP